MSQDEYVHKELIFELWSTGGFEQTALDNLENAEKSTKKYKIRFFDASQIADKAKEVKNENLNRILKNYFISNPL